MTNAISKSFAFFRRSAERNAQFTQQQTAENNAKQFDLEVILTVSTKKLLTDIDNVYDILNYLTGENIFTHQLPEVLSIASEYVLSVYPQLKEIVFEDGQIKEKRHAKKFINEQKAKYGKRLSLSPMSKTNLFRGSTTSKN